MAGMPRSPPAPPILPTIVRPGAFFWTREPLVTFVCSVSLLGDLCVLGIMMLQTRRPSNSVKTLGYFAISDALTMLIQLAGMPQTLWACTVQAAVYWTATWSAWLWTMAYAHVVHTAFATAAHTTSARRDGSSLASLHAMCWGIPVLLGCVGYAFGFFGRSDAFSTEEHYYCDFVEVGWNMAAQSVCLVAILYNAYAYATVHIYVRNLLSTSVESMPSLERDAASLRLQLWPRFVLYSLSFLLTQLPDLVMLVLLLFLGKSGAPDQLSSSADAIAQLHGGVNAIVFCCTNARAFLLQQWPCCRKCAAHDDGSGRNDALIMSYRNVDDELDSHRPALRQMGP